MRYTVVRLYDPNLKIFNRPMITTFHGALKMQADRTGATVGFADTKEEAVQLYWKQCSMIRCPRF